MPDRQEVDWVKLFSLKMMITAAILLAVLCIAAGKAGF